MKRLVSLAVPAALVVSAASVVMPTETLTEASAATLTPMLPSTAAAALAPATSVPSGAVFVATNGSDSNNGKQGSPFKTLQRAARSVPAGGTIVVRGGVYRQGVGDPTSPKYGGLGTSYTSFPANVTVENYPGETVWYDGTDVATGFSQISGSNFAKSWSVPGMCDGLFYTRSFSSQTSSGPCSYSDALGSGASVGDPIMVFRNGVNLTEVSNASQLGANKFYYDQGARMIHLGFNPAGSTIEITRRAQALAILHPSGLTVRGIGFRRFASNQYTNATQGAVLVNGGSRVLFERTALTQNAGAGLVSWKTNQLTVRSSYLSQNGFNGMYYSGSKPVLRTNPSVRDNLVVEYSRLDGNNQDRYAVNCTYACSAAGIKATGTIGFIARYSSFSYNTGNRGSGLWCDEGCKGARIYGNQMVGNDRHGIVYEISDDAIIFSNLVKDNVQAGGYGEGMMLGSSNVRVYNNTLINNYNQVLIYDDSRDTTAQFAPNTTNISFVNNIVSGGGAGKVMINVRGGNASPAANTTPAQFMRVFDYNSYHQPVGTTRALYNWQDRPNTNQLINSVPAMVSAHRVESHSVAATTTANPFLSSGFTASGAAVRSGAGLPADVAALIGVPAGVAVNRGVLTLGGTPVGVTSTTAPVATTTTTTAPAVVTTATTSAAGTVVARDTFSRSVASGFGAADQVVAGSPTPPPVFLWAAALVR